MMKAILSRTTKVFEESKVPKVVTTGVMMVLCDFVSVFAIPYFQLLCCHSIIWLSYLQDEGHCCFHHLAFSIIPPHVLTDPKIQYLVYTKTLPIYSTHPAFLRIAVSLKPALVLSILNYICNTVYNLLSFATIERFVSVLRQGVCTIETLSFA